MDTHHYLNFYREVGYKYVVIRKYSNATKLIPFHSDNGAYGLYEYLISFGYNSIFIEL